MAPDDFDRDAWLSMKAAAAVLGTSRYQVQKRALLGEFELHVIRETGVILVSRASVNAAKSRAEMESRKQRR